MPPLIHYTPFENWSLGHEADINTAVARVAAVLAAEPYGIPSARQEHVLDIAARLFTDNGLPASAEEAEGQVATLFAEDFALFVREGPPKWATRCVLLATPGRDEGSIFGAMHRATIDDRRRMLLPYLRMLVAAETPIPEILEADYDADKIGAGLQP